MMELARLMVVVLYFTILLNLKESAHVLQEVFLLLSLICKCRGHVCDLTAVIAWYLCFLYLDYAERAVSQTRALNLDPENAFCLIRVHICFILVQKYGNLSLTSFQVTIPYFARTTELLLDWR
ncbi:hypothetical protein Dimus_006074 [Dionaea muscipula]